MGHSELSALSSRYDANGDAQRWGLAGPGRWFARVDTNRIIHESVQDNIKKMLRHLVISCSSIGFGVPCCSGRIGTTRRPCDCYTQHRFAALFGDCERHW